MDNFLSLFFFTVKATIILFGFYIRQFNNIDFSSEVSTVHKFVYTDEALLLVRQQNFQLTTIQELEYTNQRAY